MNYPAVAHFVEFNHSISSLSYIGNEMVSHPHKRRQLGCFTIQEGTLLDLLSRNPVSSWIEYRL